MCIVFVHFILQFQLLGTCTTPDGIIIPKHVVYQHHFWDCLTDINECEEGKPCSHNCHNTRGSFYCSCPPQLALGHTGLTCKAWGDLDLDESAEESEDGNNNEDSEQQYLEAVAETSVACRAGLVRRNNTCADMNECSDEEVCDKEETCINSYGSYYCMESPCFEYRWDGLSRSCIKKCADTKDECTKDAKVAEIVRYLPLPLNNSFLQPYQELLVLRPTSLDGQPLQHTTYDITDNNQELPIRIRIENEEGILYSMKYLGIDGLYRITIEASSFSKDYRTKLYSTDFIVILYTA